MVDYQRNRRPPVPVTRGEAVERVDSYKYVGVQINKELD